MLNEKYTYSQFVIFVPCYVSLGTGKFKLNCMIVSVSPRLLLLLHSLEKKKKVFRIIDRKVWIKITTTKSVQVLCNNDKSVENRHLVKTSNAFFVCVCCPPHAPMDHGCRWIVLLHMAFFFLFIVYNVKYVLQWHIFCHFENTKIILTTAKVSHARWFEGLLKFFFCGNTVHVANYRMMAIFQWKKIREREREEWKGITALKTACKQWLFEIEKKHPA